MVEGQRKKESENYRWIRGGLKEGIKVSEINQG